MLRESEQEEASYHSLHMVAGLAELGAAHGQQLAGSVGVQLQQGSLTPVTVLAGDRPHHGPDGLAPLHHAGVELQSLSHPPSEPAAQPDIFTGTTPGVPLQSHPA